MSNETVEGTVVDSDDTKPKFRLPSKKTLIKIGVGAVAAAAVITVVFKKPSEETDFSSVEFESLAKTETLSDLENPPKS